MEQTSKRGLQINEEKTKYMVMSRNQHPQNKIKIENYSFEIQNKFIYLGTSLTSNNDISADIETRIASANRAYFALRPILKSQIVHRNTKLRIYKSLIRPIVTYGAETWIMYAHITKRLAVFERKVLRKILGPIKVNGEWRIRTNSELMQLYKDLDIVAYIKIMRLKWIGHVNRMEEERVPYQVFVNQPEGRRQRGRPKTRWWDDVYDDIRKCKITRWNIRSKDRDDWRRSLEEAKVRIGL